MRKGFFKVGIKNLRGIVLSLRQRVNTKITEILDTFEDHAERGLDRRIIASASIATPVRQDILGC
jgi:hypothetical protein